MRDQFIKTLLGEVEKNPNIILITGDLGFGVLNEFIEKYPNNFINAGVAEQNMTGIAAGLALEGKKVFTYSIANFPTLRCFEQIRNDVCYHNLDVNIISIGGGFSYGSLGMSHHATEDIAVMRTLPNLDIFSPSGLWEVDKATKSLSQSNESKASYIIIVGEDEYNAKKYTLKNLKTSTQKSLSLVELIEHIKNG